MPSWENVAVLIGVRRAGVSGRVSHLFVVEVCLRARGLLWPRQRREARMNIDNIAKLKRIDRTDASTLSERLKEKAGKPNECRLELANEKGSSTK